MKAMRIKNAIIGAGISGCIMAHILKSDYLIIERSSKVGGEMSNNILGPKMFHKTKETEDFFKDYIKDSYKVKNITLKDELVVKNDDLDTYKKKIGYSFENSKNSSMSEFDALELDLDSFYKDKSILTNANIIKIDLDKHLIYILSNNEIITIIYTNIISTIDYSLFCNLCGLKNKFDLQKRGVIYANFKADYGVYFTFLKDYNFWYNLTDNEFFRCTNLKDSVTVELFTENYDNLQYQLKKYFRYVEDLKCYYNPNAKIWNNSQQQILYNSLNRTDVYLIGRNSMYNHDRIQDSIKVAKQIEKEIK